MVIFAQHLEIAAEDHLLLVVHVEPRVQLQLGSEVVGLFRRCTHPTLPQPITCPHTTTLVQALPRTAFPSALLLLLTVERKLVGLSGLVAGSE